MEDLLKNDRFAAAYEELGRVTLNPRRHTAADARSHSDAVAATAVLLGTANGCCAEEIGLLENLGRAHDIGKITGTARPARSLDVLGECGVTDPSLLTLVKWHDASLPWHRSSERGEAPSDKAWRRLAKEVDLRLLSIFMVADRVDAPGGWRRNAPTTWFLAEARSRGLLDDLVLDLPEHPSEVCAGAALVTRGARGPEILMIRTRATAWELPKGGVEWDELPEEAAVRELREEAGVAGELSAGRALGHVEYFMGNASERRLKRVVYYLVETNGTPSFSDLPSRTLERRWLRREDLSSVELIHDALARVLQDALKAGPAS